MRGNDRFRFHYAVTPQTEPTPVQRRGSYEVAREQFVESANRLRDILRKTKHVEVSGISIKLGNVGKEVLDYLP